MPIKLKCPACGVVVSVPRAAAGKKARCGGCATKFRVPQIDSETIIALPIDGPEPEPVAPTLPPDSEHQFEATEALAGFAKARRLFDNGEYDAAEEALIGHQMTNPDDPESDKLLERIHFGMNLASELSEANLLWEQGKFEAALAHLEGLDVPEDAPSLRKKVDEAIEHYKKDNPLLRKAKTVKSTHRQFRDVTKDF